MDRRQGKPRLGKLQLALLVGVFVLGLLPNFGTPAVASPRASGRIVANERTETYPAQRGNVTTQSAPANAPDTGSTGAATLLYTSDALDAGQLFDRLGVHWIAARGAEATLYFETRSSGDGVAWSDWAQVREEEDMTNEYTNEHYAQPMPVSAARFAQYRVWLTSGDAADLQKVSLTFLDVNDVNQGPVVRLFNDIAGAFSDLTRSYAYAATGAPRLLTRQDWAADETIMNWPPRYQKVQKFVVHHTVTDDGGNNVAAAIRSIYYYHAVTRGWGDIGYSYIVDKFGNIWTGRQGGDNTIGGHAYGWNNGSIGIAALGDYSINPPTGQLQGAIANIIAVKSAQFGLQPYGNDTFTHQEQSRDGTWVDITSNPPNIQGHRDCNYVLDQKGGQTACPGNGIYNMLDGLRRQAQAAAVQGYFDMPLIEPQLPKAAFPGAAINVPVTITNKGQNAIPSGTAVSYRMLKNGVVTLAQGAAGSIATPIPPGGSQTVNVPFTTPTTGSYLVRWDLQSGGTWWNSLKSTPVRDMWFNAADWSVDWVTDNVPKAWVAGETKVISVTLTNDGGRAWPATGTNPVRLGYKWVSNATGNTFPGSQRVSLPSDVQPGTTISLMIPVTAPTYPTNYTMYLDLFKENEFAFADRGIAPDDTPTGVSVDFKATYTVGAMPQLGAGQDGTVPVTITNAGRGVIPVTSSYPVNLGYHWYSATGQTVLWDGARTKLPADLQPGATVTVQAQVTAPPQGGQYSLRFDLVQEGVSWFSNKGVPTGSVTTTVAGPFIKSYGASYVPAPVASAMARTTVAVPVTVTNTSNFLWQPGGANPENLAYHWIDSTGRAVVWDGTRTKLGADLGPGSAANLQAQVTFPSAAGTYTLRWDMVEEGVSWFSGKDVRTADQVVEVTAFVTPFYGGSLDVSGTPGTLAAVATGYYAVKVQNLSNFTWGSDTNLSYHWLDAAGNAVTWDGVRTSLAGMRPNELRTVNVRVAPPAQPGSYTLRYDIVREGVTWFSDAGMQTPTRAVQIALAGYAATYAPAAPTANGAPGTTITVPVTISNVGTAVWQPGIVNASYHLFTPSGAVFVWDGARTKLAAPLDKGQSANVLLQVALPASAGTYELQIDLVQEGITWFSGQRIAPARVTLSVQ